MIRIPVLFALFAVLALFASTCFFISYAGANVTGSLNSSINSTKEFITLVNQSAYLIFYPNLTAAYSYLNKAENMSTKDPQNASSLLAKARSNAEEQLNTIYKYRTDSVVLLSIIGIILAFLIYFYMRPLKTKRNIRKRE
ncbi:MAG: hypothetical protein ACP5TL_03105 [Candidatus Micrarchaeia archaeon]